MRGRCFLLAPVLALTFAAAAHADEPQPPPPPPEVALAWVAPTPADGTQVTVAATTTLSLALAAASPTEGAVVKLNATGLPDGSDFRIADGNPATGTLTWTPTAEQVGDYTIIFGASDDQAVPAAAPPLTVIVHVTEPPKVVALQEGNVSHWAFVLRPTVARAAPNARAKVVTHISTLTGDGTDNILSLLEERAMSDGKWVRVRLAILPNNSTGWVQRSALGVYRTLNTHLYIDRTLLLAVLKIDGMSVFRTRVGVGKPYWPTPAGEFYIRDRLIRFPDTFYGPIAYGTSARSPVLTDWPGGGYVGVHGTSLPQLLPGRVSHGCVRMRNDAILRLDRLMPVGTPLTIT
jgi:hypothetical protein